MADAPWALLEASAEGYLPIVKRLVKAGADPAWVSPRGNSALSLARKRKQKSVAKWLVALSR